MGLPPGSASFKDCLKEHQYDSSLCGLHSLRAGGATAVVNSKKVSRRDFSWFMAGGKHSTTNMYKHEDISRRLQATGHLGI